MRRHRPKWKDFFFSRPLPESAAPRRRCRVRHGNGDRDRAPYLVNAAVTFLSMEGERTNDRLKRLSFRFAVSPSRVSMNRLYIRVLYDFRAFDRCLIVLPGDFSTADFLLCRPDLGLGRKTAA